MLYILVEACVPYKRTKENDHFNVVQITAVIAERLYLKPSLILSVCNVYKMIWLPNREIVSRKYMHKTSNYPRENLSPHNLRQLVSKVIWSFVSPNDVTNCSINRSNCSERGLIFTINVDTGAT